MKKLILFLLVAFGLSSSAQLYRPFFDPTQYGFTAVTGGSNIVFRNGGQITNLNAVSEIKFPNIAGGGYIKAETPTRFTMSGGAELTNGSWVARSTAGSILQIDGQQSRLYQDDGLTAGNAYTPTKSFSVSAGTTGTRGINNMSQSQTLNVFGDSFTLWNDGTNFPTAYCQYRGLNLNDLGVSGTSIMNTGQVWYAFNTTVGINTQTLFLSGFNNMRNMGTSASLQAEYQGVLAAMCAYLTIPDAFKFYASLATFGGSWANPVAYANNRSRVATVAGATATFNPIGGTAVYVCLTKTNGAAGAVSVAVDGIGYGIYDCGGATVSPDGATKYEPFLVTIDNLPYAVHTVLITVVTNGAAQVDWVVGNSRLGNEVQPALWLGNCCRMNNTGYTLGGPTFNNGSDAAVFQFNRIIENVASMLARTGLNVRYCDVSSVFDITTDVGADNIHPNALGATHIAQAFLHASNQMSEGAERGDLFSRSPPSIYVGQKPYTLGLDASSVHPVLKAQPHDLFLASGMGFIDGRWVASDSTASSMRLAQQGLNATYDTNLTAGTSFTPTSRLPINAGVQIKSGFGSAPDGAGMEFEFTGTSFITSYDRDNATFLPLSLRSSSLTFVNGDTWTFPTTHGAAGSVLTDVAGNGVLTMQAPGGGSVALNQVTADTGSSSINNGAFTNQIVGGQENGGSVFTFTGTNGAGGVTLTVEQVPGNNDNQAIALRVLTSTNSVSGVSAISVSSEDSDQKLWFRPDNSFVAKVHDPVNESGKGTFSVSPDAFYVVIDQGKSSSAISLDSVTSGGGDAALYIDLDTSGATPASLQMHTNSLSVSLASGASTMTLTPFGYSVTEGGPSNTDEMKMESNLWQVLLDAGSRLKLTGTTFEADLGSELIQFSATVNGFSWTDITGIAFFNYSGIGSGLKYNTGNDDITLPNIKGAAGSVWTDVAGNGVVTEEPLPSTFSGSIYGVGTAYTVTTTLTNITFGTTSPVYTLTNTGTYMIFGRVNYLYNGATFAANRTVTTAILDNTATAFVPNSTTTLKTAIVTTFTASLEAGMSLPPVIYTTSTPNTVLKLQTGIDTGPSAGSLDITEASIVAVKLY